MKQLKSLKNFFNLFLQRYEEGLAESVKGSEFVFNSVDLLNYKLKKISLKRGGSYIDSLEWLKNKKVTINPCFQHALTVALNYQNIKKNPQRI